MQGGMASSTLAAVAPSPPRSCWPPAPPSFLWTSPPPSHLSTSCSFTSIPSSPLHCPQSGTSLALTGSGGSVQVWLRPSTHCVADQQSAGCQRQRQRGAGCQRQPAESRGVELPPPSAAASILLSLVHRPSQQQLPRCVSGRKAVRAPRPLSASQPESGQ